MSRKVFLFLRGVFLFTLLMSSLSLTFTNAKAGSCNPGEVCTFPTPNDPNYRYNMLHAFQVKGDSWTIKNGQSDTFNAHFGDFTDAQGYLYASGVIGGGICDVASIVNHVLVVNGLSTSHALHIIGGIYYPVMGVPKEDTVVIWDYNGPGPSGSDLRVTNNTGHDVTLKWTISGTNINLWAETDGGGGNSGGESQSNENAKSQEDKPKAKSIKPPANKPQTFVVEGGVALEVTPVPAFLATIVEIFADIAPYRTLIVIFFGLLTLAFLGSLIYSGEFRKMTVTLVIVAVIVFGGFLGVKKVMANTTTYNPPREPFTVELPTKTWSVNLEESVEENTTPSETPSEASSDCSLPNSYSQSVLQWCGYIEKYASKNGLEPRLVAAVMTQESDGNPSAYSSAGATGLLQVMPRDGIAASYTNANGVPYFSDRPSTQELYDPEFNIQYGSDMLADLISRYGSVRDGLLHYGPSDCGYYYADLVLSIYNNYQ